MAGKSARRCNRTIVDSNGSMAGTETSNAASRSSSLAAAAAPTKPREQVILKTESCAKKDSKVSISKMVSVSTLWFLKLRLDAKSRLFIVKFHFGHKILYLKSRLYVKSRFVKSRLYCSVSRTRGEKNLIEKCQVRERNQSRFRCNKFFFPGDLSTKLKSFNFFCRRKRSLLGFFPPRLFFSIMPPANEDIKST